MRIAVITWSRRRVGGTETYLSQIIPHLVQKGHNVCFWHERDEPSSREPIPLPDGVPAWCVSILGSKRALTTLREWKPDLIYNHSLHDDALEAEILKIAPAVFFAHAYYGTCISGSKTFKRPVLTPCNRKFGWKCLLQYYPHRCGGLSPLTMLQMYQLQSRRLKLLKEYAAILTYSSHMQSEYIKHGFPKNKVHNLSGSAHGLSVRSQPTDVLAEADENENGNSNSPHHLLFSGRMESLKGGELFIDALPQIRNELGPIRVTFAGDGPERATWESKASKLAASTEGLDVQFSGWIQDQAVNSLYAECDLLVFPSVWPEPFGLAGPEAGLQGLPAAAFDVGGVSEWLTDGFNGHLASGDPPTSRGLVRAIVKCLQNPVKHERLRRGAIEAARQFSFKNHLAALIRVFEEVVPSEADACVRGGAEA